MNLSEWYGVAKTSEILGISQSLLWELKQTNELTAGEHWIYATGKRKSNVLWNAKYKVCICSSTITNNASV